MSRKRRERPVPSPAIYSLNDLQARWLKEAEEEGAKGRYVPITSGREPGELVEAGLATFREVCQVVNTRSVSGKPTCEYSEFWLVITDAGRAMLQRYNR